MGISRKPLENFQLKIEHYNRLHKKNFGDEVVGMQCEKNYFTFGKQPNL